MKNRLVKFPSALRHEPGNDNVPGSPKPPSAVAQFSPATALAVVLAFGLLQLPLNLARCGPNDPDCEGGVMSLISPALNFVPTPDDKPREKINLRAPTSPHFTPPLAETQFGGTTALPKR